MATNYQTRKKALLIYLVISSSKIFAMSEDRESQSITFIRTESNLTSYEKDTARKLNEIKNLMKDNNINEAYEKIETIEKSNIRSDQVKDEYFYVYSQMLKIRHMWGKSIQQAKKISTQKAIEKKIGVKELIAELYQKSRQYIKEAETIYEIQNIKKDNSSIIYEMIWMILKSADIEDLISYRKKSDYNFGGWIDLMIIAKSRIPRSQINGKLSKWKSSYKNHPGAQFIEAIQEGVNKNPFNPKKIAVLLTEEDQYKIISNSIKEGMMKAIEDNYEFDNIQINFYNTQYSPNRAYQEAIDDKADFIIGPLIKTHIVKTMNNYDDSVPQILLNLPDNNKIRENKFYLNLSRRQDILESVLKMTADGISRPIVFYKYTPRNIELAKQFSYYWKQNNFKTPELYSYYKLSDIKQTINKGMLNDEHFRKKSLLSNVFGNIKSDTRSRKDIDGVFVINNEIHEIKMIKPFIEISTEPNSKHLPVYAINRANPNYEKINQDDLKGIIYYDVKSKISDDIKLAIKKEEREEQTRMAQAENGENKKEQENNTVAQEENLKQSEENLKQSKRLRDMSAIEYNLTCIGYDAINLIKHIRRMKNSENSYKYRGKSGTFETNNRNVIQLKKQWYKHK